MSFILTVDVGTSSCRALLYDERGAPVPGVGARQPLAPTTAADGTAEFAPEALLSAIWACLDETVAQASNRSLPISAVGWDTLATTLVPLAADGTPLAPLHTYADTRATDDAAALRRSLDEAAVQRRTGCRLRAAYWPARLRWFQRAHPDIWHQAAHWATLGELIERALFGVARVSLSAASWTGLLDVAAGQWDAALCDAVELAPGKLAPLVDADAPLVGLRAPFASRWPALRQVPFFPAVGDGAAANIGSGCIGAHRPAITIGTTGAVRAALEHVPQVPAGGWAYRVNGALLLAGGATSEGGNLWKWLRTTVQLSEDTEAALGTRPADSHGLTVLPFVAGERSPGWAGDVRATITGISTATTPIDLAQACLEAVAYRLALIAAQLPLAADAIFVASGGALLQSPAWLRICADVLGRPVVASAEPEATSRGVALLALHALGHLPDLAALPPAEGQRYTPDAARHAIYRAAIERQQQLYAALIPS